jgi:hypothetical protein
MKFFKNIFSKGISRILYSTVLLLSVMEGFENYPTNSFVIIGVIILSALSIMIMESFAHILEHDIEHKAISSSKEVISVLKSQFPVFAATIYPCIFFILSTTGILSIDTAFDISEYSLCALLFFYGFNASRLSGGRFSRNAFYGFTSFIIGLLIANVKVLADFLKKIA